MSQKMSKAETKSAIPASGVGIAGLLGVAFVILKLIGVITWSWLWVLAPFWIPAALWVAVVVPVLLVLFIAAVAKAMK